MTLDHFGTRVLAVPPCNHQSFSNPSPIVHVLICLTLQSFNINTQMILQKGTGSIELDLGGLSSQEGQSCSCIQPTRILLLCTAPNNLRAPANPNGLRSSRERLDDAVPPRVRARFSGCSRGRNVRKGGMQPSFSTMFELCRRLSSTL